MADTLPTPAPAAGPAGTVLRATYHIITSALQNGHVDSEVRRSLELVRTCDRDLQHLIGLRDQYLDILERKPPIELERVNMVIKEAHDGLTEVCKIVEKCRPDVNKGKISFKRRSRWILLDSAEFHSQIPAVSGHHRAVLSEISFLRQISLQDVQAPASVPNPNQEDQARHRILPKKAVEIDNIALLGNLMGGKAGAFTLVHDATSKRKLTPRPQDGPPVSGVYPHQNTQPGQPSYSPAPPPYALVDRAPYAVQPFQQTHSQVTSYSIPTSLNFTDFNTVQRDPSPLPNASPSTFPNRPPEFISELDSERSPPQNLSIAELPTGDYKFHTTQSHQMQGRTTSAMGPPYPWSPSSIPEPQHHHELHSESLSVAQKEHTVLSQSLSEDSEWNYDPSKPRSRGPPLLPKG